DYGDRVWLLKAFSPTDSDEAPMDSRNAWRIAIDDATEEHLRDVWRQVCQMGIAREVTSGR
ncbi:MAG: hypothetical protein ACK553_05660, partial [Planctomycetota bacterium]